MYRNRFEHFSLSFFFISWFLTRHFAAQNDNQIAHQIYENRIAQFTQSVCHATQIFFSLSLSFFMVIFGRNGTRMKKRKQKKKIINCFPYWYVKLFKCVILAIRIVALIYKYIAYVRVDDHNKKKHRRKTK